MLKMHVLKLDLNRYGHVWIDLALVLEQEQWTDHLKGYGQISTIFTDTNLWTKIESDRPGDTYGQIFTVKLQIQTYEQVFTYWQILTDIGTECTYWNIQTNIYRYIYINKYWHIWYIHR